MSISLLLSILVSLIIFFSPIYFKKFLSISSLQNFVVTLGILGTFTGIVIALLQFDVDNVYNSIPNLLAGLRFAFFTSVSGLVSNIILRWKPKFYLIEIPFEQKSDDFIEIFYREIKELKSQQNENLNKQYQQLLKIEKALCGEGDTTLLTQIIKLRTLISDKQDDLIKEFRLFAQTMSENNSKALIEALTQVMKDFNTKINEQLGENFAKFNNALGQLLIWQENYKEQLTQLIKQFEKTVEGITITERAIYEIKNDFSQITQTSNKLKELIEIFYNQINLFNEISKNAEKLFPTIEQNINRLTTDFHTKVVSATKELEQITKMLNLSVEQQVRSISESSQALSNGIEKSVTELNRQIESFLKNTAQRLSNQVTELDKMLQDELTKSLTSFANQLASLSHKFASDYTPITNKLKEILDSMDLRG